MTTLEKMSHVSVIAAALFVIGSAVTVHYNARASTNTRTTTSPAVGQKIRIPGVSASQATLVLAVSSHCHFCVSSVPFYQRISSLRDGNKLSVKLIAAMPESKEDSMAFLTNRSISVDQIDSVTLSDLSVQGTPTLLLVSTNGEVLREWVGQLNAEGEKEVIKAISKNGSV